MLRTTKRLGKSRVEQPIYDTYILSVDLIDCAVALLQYEDSDELRGSLSPSQDWA